MSNNYFFNKYKSSLNFTVNQTEQIVNFLEEDWFLDLCSKAHIFDTNQSDMNKNFECIKEYIFTYYAYSKVENFTNAVDIFINFFKDYSKNKIPNFISSPTSSKYDITTDLLYCSNGHHIYNDFRFASSLPTVKGNYVKGIYIGTDHSYYIGKNSMRKSLHDLQPSIEYNALVAQAFFEYFNQPVAQYFLLKQDTSPFGITLSKSFLDSNQELIGFDEFYTFDKNPKLTYESIINNFLSNIKARLNSILLSNPSIKPEDITALLSKLKLEYCIQEFMKLFINRLDPNLGNTSLLLTHTADSLYPQYNISPAYDLELTFNSFLEPSLQDRFCYIKDLNNNPVTIEYFMSVFSDFSDFSAFLSDFVQKIKSYPNISDKIVTNAVNKNGLEYLSTHYSDYVDFFNNRFANLVKHYESIKGDDSNEIVLE